MILVHGARGDFDRKCMHVFKFPNIRQQKETLYGIIPDLLIFQESFSEILDSLANGFTFGESSRDSDEVRLKNLFAYATEVSIYV
jgi:hypothetical protein